ncbi:hypothetical protein KL864_31055 [Mycolicibacterium goodii]|nr:hypothetical protein [Mycolicibacterium goodii]
MGIVNGRWQPLPLRVDPVLHRDEIERFQRKVVRGPRIEDCAIYTGALSEGYGVFAIRRDGHVRVVRAARYALALAMDGMTLPGQVRALHQCDNPVCVRTVSAQDNPRGLALHVVAGDQRENMTRMARMKRGGGRPAIVRRGAGVHERVARALALRDAVRNGWDDEAVARVLLGTDAPTLW